jgi:hypothetical protein
MTKELVRKFIEEVWNERRLGLLEELVVGDYELRNLSDGSVAVRGRQPVAPAHRGLVGRVPDLALRETDCLDAGARVASVTTMTGTHTGEDSQGLDAREASIEVTIVAIFTGDGERLLSHGTLLDARRLIDQLGRSGPG